MKRAFVMVVGSLALACERGAELPAPANFSYRLDVSGDPLRPGGVLWTWEAISSPSLQAYRIYSRPDQSSVFGLRATTTSTSFHDVGQPHLEYFVVAVNQHDREGVPSEPVVVDERLRLESPDWLVTTSLNRAIHLAWADNPYASDPGGFSKYHVYSAPYSLDDNLCGATWVREGTTVAPEFLAGALTNGVPRCFAVSAESIEGWESLWSDIRADTPRPDGRNVLAWAFEVDAAKSGFRFFRDANGDGAAAPNELGLVEHGGQNDVDFRVERDGSGSFWLTPVRSGTELRLYSTQPIADLTSINVAPVSGYAAVALQALPRYGYVFRMNPGDGFYRYGAIRVTHVGREYMIFDWSYQTDRGNPELAVGR